MRSCAKGCIAAGLLVLSLIGCTPVQQTNVASLGELNDLIRKDIPVHASSAEVIVFLDRNHIEHSDMFSDEKTITSIVRDTTTKGQVRGAILIKFYFDRKARLKNYSVEEVFTGV